MPNIDLVEILKITFKMILVGLFLALTYSYIAELRNIIGELLTTMGVSSSGLNGMDLGCIGEKLGLKDFLNSLTNTVFIAGHFLLSAVATIFGFKFGFIFYRYLMDA